MEDFLLFTAPVKNIGPEGGAKIPRLRLEFGLRVGPSQGQVGKAVIVA